MNDRLGDLGADLPSWASGPSGGGGVPGKKSNPFDDDDDHHNGAPKKDVESGMPPEENPANDGKPSKMELFFKDIDSIKADIDAVKDATKRIHEINEEAALATSTDRENELSQELRPLVDVTNKRAKRTKNFLTQLKEENSKLKAEGGLKSGDMRIRENLCNTLTRKFIDEMKLYQNAQQKYKTDIRKKVTRQVQIVKPDATNEEVDMVMKSEGGREALYKEQILSGGVNDSIKTAYAKVAGKYQDVLTLEQSVAELHQMFLDFALLTEQQGELLDQIEFQVRSAADYVEDANVEVHEAIELQKAIRMKQCWIIVIVIGVIAALVFILRLATI